MVLVSETIGLISGLIAIAHEVENLAAAAQRNTEKCSELKVYVKQIIPLLEGLDKEWMPDPVMGLLENLSDVLKNAKKLVETCQEKRTWSLVFKTEKKAQMLDAINGHVDRIMSQFHVANMILIVNINKERIFGNVFDKLIGYGACRGLQQRQKDELKSYVVGINTGNNTTSELLERLIRELADGDAAMTSASPSVVLLRPGPGGHRDGKAEETPTSDHVAAVRDLALFIVKQATALRNNRQEIQQLAQFVQEVAELMDQPQSPVLYRDPRTRLVAMNLKHDLEHAYDIVMHNERNMIFRTILCGASWRQTDEILKVAYKIENYVHVLRPYVVTMRQMNGRQKSMNA